MDGITYFRLVSPYDQDITKNCGLTGSEIDNNFYVLEGRDVKSVTLEGDTLKVNLYNGTVLHANMNGLVEPIIESLGDYVKSLSFEFDKEKGILKITQDGVVQELKGFVTSYDDNNVIATDETLVGNGKPSNPLGVSPAYQTGAFKPVLKIVDKANGESLPSGQNLHAGDRYLVHDKVSDYGLLFNYDGVKRISCDLYLAGSKWRIPTKADWDDMLNAIEPNEADRNHGDRESNRYLGKYAGSYLKSKTGWNCNDSNDETSSDSTTTGNSSPSDTSITDMIGNTSTGHCCCGRNVQSCSPMYCGEYSTCCCRPDHHDPDASGTDLYGFNAKPAGYADDGGLYGYFGERAAFWTATLSPSGNSAYIKRLECGMSKVYQDIISTKYSLSLRLVKDFDGSNFYGKEQILGDLYDTVMMPSLENGSRIWTSVNIAFPNDSYCGIKPNNGEGLTTSDVYYIAEWNGCRWVTSVFAEGSTVVVLTAPDGSRGVNYILIDGNLVKVSDEIAAQVIEAVQPTLDEIRAAIAQEKQEREAEDAAINRLITQEKQDREEADAEINGLIDGLDSRITQEKQDREVADAAINGRIDEVRNMVHVQESDSGQTSNFNPQTGELTLVSKDGSSNTIIVPFSFDFGDL